MIKFKKKCLFYILRYKKAIGVQMFKDKNVIAFNRLA